MELTINTLYYKDHHYVIPEAEAADYPEEMVGRFVFRHRPYDGDAAIEVGRKLNAASLLNPAGIGDADALAAARGKFLGQSVVEGGSRKVGTGEEVSITAETVGTLPVEVLAEFGSVVSRGQRITQAQLDALKKKPPTTTEPS